jgi:type I restriction enzyme S subunit
VDQRTCCGDLRFAYYLLQTLGLEEPSKDSAVPGLDRFDAHRKPIPDVDLKTQKAIANFLDSETARIDELVAKKERQELALEEEHQAFVTMAVTTGLVPAPMSPTGNPWLKEIPAHWVLSRLKFLCARVVDCLHETPVHSESGDYPSIRTADVIPGRILLDQAKRVSEDEYRTRIQRLEPAEGDVLYTREGERFGLAALVPPGVKLCLGQRMMMFRTNRRVLSAFLMWSLNGQFAYHWLKQSTAGATSPHLNISDIRNVLVPLPPLDEQRSIVKQIDKRFERKEAIAIAISSSIDRLLEFRSALISAAVTGQINVATWGKRGETDRGLGAVEADMTRAQPERQQARA